MNRARIRRPFRYALPLVAAGALSAACASSSSTSIPPTTLGVTTTSGALQGSGPVDVLYAGSLVHLFESTVGPAFHSATGYTFTGTSGDSGTLANEVKGQTLVGDVFISANPSKDQVLEGDANGNYVTWYLTFATSPLVLGYDPQSKFAASLQSQPWYQSITQPGILVGRTDPATDPKGALTVKALTTGATTFNLPALATLATNSSEVFPEASLVGRLQSHQLDAGFFYSVEATAAGFPYVPVTGVGTLQATYTITILANAPHPAAALAFVKFLLSPAGQQELSKAGLTLTSPPAVSGNPPPDVQALLSGG